MGGSVISSRVCRICYVAYVVRLISRQQARLFKPYTTPGRRLAQVLHGTFLTRAHTLSAHYLSRLLAANHHMLGHPRCCNSPARPMPTRLPAPRERDESVSDRMNALISRQNGASAETPEHEGALAAAAPAAPAAPAPAAARAFFNSPNVGRRPGSLSPAAATAATAKVALDVALEVALWM